MPVRRLLFAVIVPIVLLLASVAAPARPAAAADSATLAQYRQWIAEARQQYPYPESTDKMYRVMMCESVGDRFAVGGGRRWFGLFQYVPSTWRGSWNPYRTADLYDAKAQIFATARAWQLGKQGEWTCYRITR
jgi:hypothetical protein